MKSLNLFLLLALGILSACSLRSHPTITPTTTPSLTTTSAVTVSSTHVPIETPASLSFPQVAQTTTPRQPTATPTFTLVGTWRVTIIGTVYDSSVGKDKPLPGTRVTIARNSMAINSETQEATTNARGEYRIEMLMHDTDRVEISGKADGYMRTLQPFTGVQFHPAGEHRVDILLSPIPTPTAIPALTRTPTLIPSLTRTSMPTRLPLVPVKVTEECHGCASPQLVMDAQGTLHLFWRWAGGDTNVGYAQMKAGGTWVRQELRLSEAANENWHVFSTNYKLMRNPMGQACLAAFGNNYQTYEPALLFRCHDGTSWRDTQKLSADDCGPTSSTCDFAFAPDGFLRVLNSKQLSENPKEVSSCSFTIDHNGGYHALWSPPALAPGVLYRFSADNGQSWSAAEKLADEYALPALQPDAQGNLYYWTHTAYRRWVPTKGWEAPVDVRRYGIEEIKRLVPAADGRLRVLGGKGMGSSGIYYFEQLSDEEWSVPILVSRAGINADLVIDAKGMTHIAFDESSNIHYVAVR